MLLENEIQIKVNSTTLKHYRSKGYIVNMYDLINIKINDLTKSSNYKIKVKCDICGDEKELPYNCYLKNIKKHNIYTCSNKCATIKNKKTNLERYGNENYNNIEKNKQTCLEKYGVENIFQNEDIKDKIKQINLEKYGFESHNSSDIVKEKKKKIYLKKYGVICPLNTNEQKEKSRKIKLEKYGNFNNFEKTQQTLLKRYNITHPSMLKEFQEKRIQKYKERKIINFLSKYNYLNVISADYNNDKFTFWCINGHTFEITNSLLLNRINTTKICTICNPIGKHISGLELLFNDFVKNNCSKKIIFNTKNIIKPYELDIYLPDLKLAFEFNGLFWHNELNRNNNYHVIKTELCEKQGIHLIHIYEDDWIYKQEIVKSRILNLLGKTPNKIYARKCIIKEINDNKLVRDFLEENHLQEFVGSQIKLGLFFNDELISLMTFGSKRKFMKQSNTDGVYEILRFCGKLNTSIVGGSEKLFKYFVEKYNPKEVVSYADRSWSRGELYQKLGFKLIHKTPPNYYYVINGIRKHRFNFRKDKLIREGFDSEKTEHQIMLERKIYKIYDSGSLKFIWKN